jgi:hypothetical protein
MWVHLRGCGAQSRAPACWQASRPRSRARLMTHASTSALRTSIAQRGACHVCRAMWAERRSREKARHFCSIICLPSSHPPILRSHSTPRHARSSALRVRRPHHRFHIFIRRRRRRGQHAQGGAARDALHWPARACSPRRAWRRAHERPLHVRPRCAGRAPMHGARAVRVFWATCVPCGCVLRGARCFAVVDVRRSRRHGAVVAAARARQPSVRPLHGSIVRGASAHALRALCCVQRITQSAGACVGVCVCVRVVRRWGPSC